MTTSPNPGDFARRGRPPALTARPVATTRPAGPTSPKPTPTATSVPFRQRWETALLLTTLHRNAKLTGLVIATYADWQTGLIGDLDHPSVLRLSRAAGVEAGNVRVSLHTLRQNGWIERTEVASDTFPSRIRLLIPDRIRTRR